MKPKPSTGFEVERIPLAVRSAPRWVNWHAETRDGKWTKIPCDGARRRIDATDPANGRPFADAVESARGDAELGIGFILGDGWLGVDLDGVVDPASGAITDAQVAEWIASTQTYFETTPSKTGLHAIFEGVEIPAWSQNRRGFVEVYADKRFFTVTGHALFADRDAIADQSAVDSLCDRWLRRDKPTPPSPAGATPSGTLDHSATDYALACKLAREHLEQAEIESKIRDKMIAEGRGEKAARADYIRRTVVRALSAVETDPSASTVAERLVALARARFDLVRNAKGETFAVARDGANVAIRLDGSEMKDLLSRAFHVEHGKIAGSNAIADALAALRGEARETAPVETSLRYGRDAHRVVLDLGRSDGKAVVIDRGEWSVVDRSPILFERTALVAELPEPERGGSIDELAGLLNVDPDDFAVLVGWSVAAMLPEIAHPILFLGGGQGTGKTTAATMIAGLVDASTSPICSQPRDDEAYALAVSASHVTVIDNVSTIPGWLSDALCKTVTGDALRKRKLYADRELCVVTFRRVVVLTSIDAGALRGDLGSRLVFVELERIDKSDRKSERSLLARYAALRPRLLGALCDLTARVLASGDSLEVEGSGRMADFEGVLANLDAVRGTKSLETFRSQGERIAEEVADGDSVGVAIRDYMAGKTDGWSGTMKELLEAIAPKEPPRDFPKTPKGLGGRLKRIAPALEDLGIFVHAPSKTDKTRTWGILTARTAQPPETRTDDGENAVDPRAIPF